MVKLNISFPANGSQKLIDIEDEKKYQPLLEKRVCYPNPNISTNPSQRPATPRPSNGVASAARPG